MLPLFANCYSLCFSILFLLTGCAIQVRVSTSKSPPLTVGVCLHGEVSQSEGPGQQQAAVGRDQMRSERITREENLTKKQKQKRPKKQINSVLVGCPSCLTNKAGFRDYCCPSTVSVSFNDTPYLWSLSPSLRRSLCSGINTDYTFSLPDWITDCKTSDDINSRS